MAWEQRARLVALWASDERDRGRGYCLRVALADDEGLTVLEHTLPDTGGQYSDIATIFPAANRMQRAAFDLVGIAADGDDERPWLRHASWPIERFPLRRDFQASAQGEPGQEEYAFVPRAGRRRARDSCRAGSCRHHRAGHFRFQVVGEKVLRLEERLGYTHKGIEKRSSRCCSPTGHRLAGRVSGDSTVAYAWAYVQAAEAIAGVTPPPRAQWLRALALERERVANHLGDLGYLGNDGGSPSASRNSRGSRRTCCAPIARPSATGC